MPVNNNHQYEQYDEILETKLQYMFKSKIKMEVKKNFRKEKARLNVRERYKKRWPFSSLRSIIVFMQINDPRMLLHLISSNQFKILAYSIFKKPTILQFYF